MINRAAHVPLELVFTTMELHLLNARVKDTPAGWRKKTLSTSLTKVAQLGGYLARATDSPPSNLVTWRGRPVSAISNSELPSVLTLWVMESLSQHLRIAQVGVETTDANLGR
jgi:hypothetical protein